MDFHRITAALARSFVPHLGMDSARNKVITFSATLIPRPSPPFSTSASRILDLGERRYYSRVSPRTFYLPLARLSDVFYLPELALFLAEESILASYCSVSTLHTFFFCIPFNKNSADAAEITLRLGMRNDEKREG